MKKMQKVFMAIMAALALSLAAQAGESRFMNFAGPPGSSNYYPYWVAVAKAVQTVYPEFRINVSESQGAIDIVRKVRAGMTPVGNSQSNSDYENYFGQGLFKDKPNKEARVMWYFDESPVQFIILDEANIKTSKDLEGKRLNPGGTGTAVAIITMQMMEVLGVKPQYFDAGQASAADAVSNRQIVGTVKTGNILGPDSYMMQIKANVGVGLLSFTDDEIAQIYKAYPYLIPWKIPAGLYDWINTDTNTVKIMMGSTSTTKISQEEGYKIFSAVMSKEGRALLDAAFPNGAKQDVVALTLNAKTPLHAGTVQYMHENGVEVPAELIPPEYVKK